MTTTSRHHAHDQLLSRVRLAERRLSRLQDELQNNDEWSSSELAERATELTARCRELADEIRRWTEVRIGASTAVEDLASAADALEADLLSARATEPDHYEEAVDRQVRTWRTRIDRLRLQRGLASMETRDELEDLGDRLEHARDIVIADLQNVVGDAKETVIDLRTDIEKVVVDVRKAVEHVAASLTRN